MKGGRTGQNLEIRTTVNDGGRTGVSRHRITFIQQFSIYLYKQKFALERIFCEFDCVLLEMCGIILSYSYL